SRWGTEIGPGAASLNVCRLRLSARRPSRARTFLAGAGGSPCAKPQAADIPGRPCFCQNAVPFLPPISIIQVEGVRRARSDPPSGETIMSEIDRLRAALAKIAAVASAAANGDETQEDD